jgi:hypothetical protein
MMSNENALSLSAAAHRAWEEGITDDLNLETLPDGAVQPAATDEPGTKTTEQPAGEIQLPVLAANR